MAFGTSTVNVIPSIQDRAAIRYVLVVGAEGMVSAVAIFLLTEINPPAPD